MRKFAVVLLLGTLASAQQGARVTFYSLGGYFRGSGKNAATLGIGTGETVAQGGVYEGNTRLVLLTPGRFLTLDVAPGTHAYSTVPESKNPQDDRRLSVEAKAGESYFIRLSASHKGAWIVQKISAHLELMPCAEARAEASGAKPAQIRFIKEAAREKLEGEAYFPRCEPTK